MTKTTIRRLSGSPSIACDYHIPEMTDTRTTVWETMCTGAKNGQPVDECEKKIIRYAS